METGPPPFELAQLGPAIRWWMWIAFALLLIIARFMPSSLPRRTVGVVVCGSIALAGVCLHRFVTTLDANPSIERKGTFDPLIAELARTYQRERPTLLVIGSSRSTLGLDGAALEQQLDARLRRDVQVLQFSSPGQYALEQLYTTRKLLDRLRPERLTVLVELGTEIDLGVPDALTSTRRGIEFFDARVFMVNLRMWRSARAGNADHPAYTYRLLLRALAHTAQRHLGVGLLFDIGPPAPPGSEKGFAPNKAVPPASVIQDVRDALAKSATTISQPSDQDELVAMVRTELAEDLADLVPERVELLFFFPPTAGPHMRAAAPRACAAVAKLGACLYMSDEEVRTHLPVDRWMDVGHLSPSGAASFTDWLAARLAEKLADR
ncbi:MAG: hypothetical protein H0V17_31165 [Deltaproteobacteria bacterium]|nr:hypothetical protein [Deltaproteobacteria bacterium]